MKGLALFLLVLLCACSLDLTEKRSCIRQSDCNRGWTCSAGTCQRGHAIAGDGDGDGDGASMDAGDDAGADAGQDGGAGLPEGLALWLKADVEVLDGTGMPAAANARVARWKDQSSHGFDATQALLSVQPTFAPTGGPVGGPAVVFDGVNDLLTLDDHYIFADSDRLGMMFFVVVRSDKQVPHPPHPPEDLLDQDPFLMSFGAGGNNDWALFYDVDTISFRAGTRQTPYTEHGVGSGNWTILTYQLVFGEDMRVRINGEEVVWWSAQLVPRLTAAEINEWPIRKDDAGPVVIGGQSKLLEHTNRYFGGAIAEIRVFDRALDGNTRDEIECELSEAYGIPLNMYHEDCD